MKDTKKQKKEYEYEKENDGIFSSMLSAAIDNLNTTNSLLSDAENEEMTVALGENFRFQLQSIFKILVKAGIDVERR